MCSQTVSALEKSLQERILIIDGAMGTIIQTLNLTEEDYRGTKLRDHDHDLKGNNEVLNLTKPELIKQIHRAYIDAGADIIETNTFNANLISQSDYGLQSYSYELNLEATRLAKEAIAESSTNGRQIFVAGSLGPTNKTASLSPDVEDPGFRNVSFSELVTCYSDALSGLLAGQVDFIMVETIFDTLNAKAAIFAIEQTFANNQKRLPVMISGTITDASGRTLSGQTTEAFCYSIAHSRSLITGLNCALGAAEMRPYLEIMGRINSTYISVHPNAGLPNAFGEYEQSPDEMAAVIDEFAASGFINLVGGCCGTTPDHIRAIKSAVARYSPRTRPHIEQACRLAGLEPLVIDDNSLFVNIGERTNITGSAKFARLIINEKFDEAVEVARQQVRNGAQIIDINMDEGMVDGVAAMTRFVNLISSEPDIARVPIMIDSSKWSVIEAGLKCSQGKPIINSISLKEGEEQFLQQATTARMYGAAVIVMAFDEQGQADTQERKMKICRRAFDLLVNKVGFPAEDIIFDPNIFAIATGMEEHNNYAVEFIETCKQISNELKPALISGGVSNISFSMRGNNLMRECIHAVFLYHAIKAGLRMGIVNAGQLTSYDSIPKELRLIVEDAVLNKNKNATERLLEAAQQNTGNGQKKTNREDLTWREAPVEDRVREALVRGINDFIIDDVKEAKEHYSSIIEIIEGPLMSGMNVVGDLFSSGKMFLPQVVKSARVMKQGVRYLTPFLQAEQKKHGKIIKTRGKILIATVKGDVHDIGKNIVSVVLQCNNYEMIDLGVMVPCTKILDTAKQENVDIVALSGLITPSLDEMVYVASEMQRLGFTIPLMIGGATTSKAHTAVKIEPTYQNGPTIYVSDASRSVTVASTLLGDKSAVFCRETREEYSNIRERMKLRKAKTTALSIADARKNPYVIDWKNYTPFLPANFGTTTLKNIDLQELVPYVDWSMFFISWGIAGKYPQVLTDPKLGQAATELYSDGSNLLQRVIAEKLLKAVAVFGFWPAQRKGTDDIVLYQDATKSKVAAELHHLRQQAVHAQDRPNHCLADYIAPENGPADSMGAFVVSIHGAHEQAEKFEKDSKDDYSAIMIKALADRLTEALCEWLHEKVRTEYWGYAPNEKLDLQNLLKESYQGIRPAPGYPACPDHTEKHCLFNLLQAEQETNVYLTESLAMYPAASVCGWFFAHPETKYFGVGKIERDQVHDYAKRKGYDIKKTEKWLRPSLGYEV